MEEKNCERLFEYLRSILYDTKVQELNIEELDEPFRKLGMGLQYLDHAVQEMKAYSADLSIGNLSGFYPGRDNFLCENLKNLHANLNHLTWQAKQVASGDYSQQVFYLGEFSEAFNTMTKQLCEREKLLKQEAEKEKRRAAAIEGYHELFLEMMRRSNEQILVVDAETREIMYGNLREEREPDSSREQTTLEQLVASREDISEKIWEISDGRGRVFRVITVLIEWQGRRAYAHILRDVTQEKQETERLADQAYTDLLTGIGNRFYFKEQAEQLLKQNVPILCCYFDLDHLKYINDRYGHAEGDEYIRRFVRAVKIRIREKDIFARIGGDEFCAVFQDCPEETAREKLAQILEDFRSINGDRYPSGFSYGMIEIKEEAARLTVSDMMRLADAEMYKQKRLHKQTYEKELEFN